jgi:hypothetical protein
MSTCVSRPESFTLNIEKAQRELGYPPVVSWDQVMGA